MYQSIREALDDLPDSAQDVRLFLKVRGYTGDHTACNCPVANFLRAETPAILPAVLPGYACEHYDDQDDRDKRIPLPTGVRQFVVLFDANQFPELIALYVR